MSTRVWADTHISEISKPVQCADFRSIVHLLSRDPYNEIPVWFGNDGADSSKYVLFANAKKGSWTLVQYGTETGCVLGAGMGSSITDPGTRL